MTQTERKVIRAKVGLLELAKQLGNGPRPAACPAIAGTASTASATSTIAAASWRWLR